jgi:sugar lactone lactonase YvrE
MKESGSKSAVLRPCVRLLPATISPLLSLLLFSCSLLALTVRSYAQIVLPGSGIIDTVAGSGSPGFSGDGGPATSAKIDDPDAVAVDSSGNIYIADAANSRIREVTASTCDISTVAGNGTAGYTGDGYAATSAELSGLVAVAVDSSGNIYIVDGVDSVVRKVTASTGIISTIAGGGSSPFCSGATDSVGDGCAATAASLANPWGVAMDTTGNVYIADLSDYRVRMVAASTGIITTVAGNGSGGYSGDGGAATSAKLNAPDGVAVDSSGNIYIADVNNDVVREVLASTGVISTVAGNGVLGYSGDGGAATSAKLQYPVGLAVDSSGNIYIADSWNFSIREVSASTGDISTVAGNGHNGYSGDGGAATSAMLSKATDVTLDNSGNLYIADIDNQAVRAIGH